MVLKDVYKRQPMWSLNKWEVLNAIDKEMERRDSWQGCKVASEKEEKA